MIVGFTGTRSGMSTKQYEEIVSYLTNNMPKKVHHGMCIGADEHFHMICDLLDIETICGHPGKSAKDIKGAERPFRANVDVDELYPEDTHFSRNRRIVDLSDILLACPYNDNGQGGTWYTINYAKKVGKPYIIFTR